MVLIVLLQGKSQEEGGGGGGGEKEHVTTSLYSSHPTPPHTHTHTVVYTPTHPTHQKVKHAKTQHVKGQADVSMEIEPVQHLYTQARREEMGGECLHISRHQTFLCVNHLHPQGHRSLPHLLLHSTMVICIYSARYKASFMRSTYSLPSSTMSRICSSTLISILAAAL